MSNVLHILYTNQITFPPSFYFFKAYILGSFWEVPRALNNIICLKYASDTRYYIQILIIMLNLYYIYGIYKYRTIYILSLFELDYNDGNWQ